MLPGGLYFLTRGKVRSSTILARPMSARKRSCRASRLAGIRQQVARQLASRYGQPIRCGRRLCGRRPGEFSDFRLFRQFQCIVDFDAEVSDRALKFAMAEQYLHGSQVPGAPLSLRTIGRTGADLPQCPEHARSQSVIATEGIQHGYEHQPDPATQMVRWKVNSGLYQGRQNWANCVRTSVRV